MGRDGACSRRRKEELVFVERLAESKCGMQRCETLQFYDARPVRTWREQMLIVPPFFLFLIVSALCSLTSTLACVACSLPCTCASVASF